jgi:hypothetical protein
MVGRFWRCALGRRVGRRVRLSAGGASWARRPQRRGIGSERRGDPRGRTAGFAGSRRGPRCARKRKKLSTPGADSRGVGDSVRPGPPTHQACENAARCGDFVRFWAQAAVRLALESRRSSQPGSGGRPHPPAGRGMPSVIGTHLRTSAPAAADERAAPHQREHVEPDQLQPAERARLSSARIAI